MSTSANSRSGRSFRNWLSLGLFAIAAILFVAVAAIYIRDRNEEDPPPPTAASVPGKAVLKNVLDAVRAQGVEADFIRGIEAGARSDQLDQPGQGITADGNPFYVFIYEDPAAREADTDGLDPAELDLFRTRGTPVAGGAPHAVGGSNVYAVLLGGDAELAAKIDRAIQGLP